MTPVATSRYRTSPEAMRSAMWTSEPSSSIEMPARKGRARMPATTATRQAARRSAVLHIDALTPPSGRRLSPQMGRQAEAWMGSPRGPGQDPQAAPKSGDAADGIDGGQTGTDGRVEAMPLSGLHSLRLEVSPLGQRERFAPTHGGIVVLESCRGGSRDGYQNSRMSPEMPRRETRSRCSPGGIL